MTTGKPIPIGPGLAHVRLVEGDAGARRLYVDGIEVPPDSIAGVFVTMAPGDVTTVDVDIACEGIELETVGARVDLRCPHLAPYRSAIAAARLLADQLGNRSRGALSPVERDLVEAFEDLHRGGPR